MVKIGPKSFAVSTSRGQIWILDLGVNDLSNQKILQLYQNNDREDINQGNIIKTPININSLDVLLVQQNPQSQEESSVHPNFCHRQDLENRLTEWLIIGNQEGKIAIFRNRLLVMIDQTSQNSVMSVKFINSAFRIALTTSDGSLNILQMKRVRNKFCLQKVGSYFGLDELSSQVNISQLSFRGSSLMQFKAEEESLEACQSTLFAIMWPKRILRRVNRMLGEDKMFAESAFFMINSRERFHPQIDRRDIQPILFAEILPQKFTDFVPRSSESNNDMRSDQQIISANYENDEVTLPLKCQRFCYLVDKVDQNLLVCEYDFATDTKKALINVSQESGLQPEDQYRVVRFDVRPGTNLADASELKFLLTLEMVGILPGPAYFCCHFVYDKQRGILTQNVIQLQGMTSIYIGRIDYQDPSIIVLNEDMRSVLIFSFDDGDLERKMPHGEVRLTSEISGVFWTPLRDGLAVAYEIESDKLVTFSKNRLERYSEGDFGVLVSRNVGLKLQSHESVLDLKWTGYALGSFADSTSSSDRIKGVLATNRHIYVVDDKLGVQAVLRHSYLAIQGVSWLGTYSILLTTEDHLVHIYGRQTLKKSVLFSLTKTCLSSDKNEKGKNSEQQIDIPSKSTLVKALSDRVILARKSLSNETKILSRSIILLDPLLLGYLSYVSVGRANLQNVQDCLKFLDTNMISGELLNALQEHKFHKSLQFLIKNQELFLSKITLPIQQLLQSQSIESFFKNLFPKIDIFHLDPEALVSLKKKLSYDPGASNDRQIIAQKVAKCIEIGMLKDAMLCAELISDVDLMVQILKKCKSQKFIESFLEIASLTEEFKPIDFNFELQNHRNYDNALSIVPEKQITKHILAYDEVPVHYECTLTPSESDQTQSKRMGQMFLNPENLSIFLGEKTLYSNSPETRANIVNQEIKPVMQIDNQQQIEQDKDQERESDDIISESSSQIEEDAFEIDEKRYLIAYWRCQEGKGNQVGDITENELNLVPDKNQLSVDTQRESQLQWGTEALENGNPLDYEDKWGKIANDSFSFVAPIQGLVTTKKMQKGGKSRVLEFWLKLDQTDSEFLLQIIQSDQGDESVFLQINDTESVIVHQKQGIITQQLVNIERGIWTHLSMIQTSAKLLINTNFQETLCVDNVGSLLLEQQFKVFIATIGTIEITEIRFYSKNIPLKLIKSQSRQPLSILFELSRNLAIKISKKAANELQTQKFKSNLTEAKPKKKGGLKLKSKFDKTKQKPENQKDYIDKFETSVEINEQIQFQTENQLKSNLEILKEESQEQEQKQIPNVEKLESETAQDNFGFNFGLEESKNKEKGSVIGISQDNLIPKYQDQNFEGWEFGQEITEKDNQNDIQQPVEIQNDQGFDFFQPNLDQSLQSPEQSDQAHTSHAQLVKQIDVPPQNDFFGFELTDEQQDRKANLEIIQISKDNDDQKLEPSNETDLSNAQEIESKVFIRSELSSQKELKSEQIIEEILPQNTKKITELDPPQNDIIEKIEDHEVISQVLSQDSIPNILDETMIVSMPEEIKEDLQSQELKPQIIANQEQNQISIEPVSPNETIESIAQLIIEAKIDEACIKVDHLLAQCIDRAQKVSQSNQKAKIKALLRQVVILRFACQISKKIAEIRLQSKQIADSSMQSKNLNSKSASLANLLVILKLPVNLRLQFFRFSLKQNIKVENFDSVRKVAIFWKKSNKSDGLPLEPKDLKKLEEAEKLAELKSHHNKALYMGSDCQACGANLAFGLATPQCFKCKASIAICYLTLRPQIRDKTAVKCHVCHGVVAIDQITNQSQTCPICQLVRLKLP